MKSEDIDELLMLSGARGTGAKSALINSLENARAHIGIARRRQNPPPPDLFEKIENHVRLTITLLEQLEKHEDWSDVCFEDYVAGTGIADVRTCRELFDKRTTLPRRPKINYGPATLPADGKLIVVNTKEVLRSISYNIKRQRRGQKRGGKEKKDKTWGVGIAKNFFVRYSTKKPSTHPGGTFALFCERFISVAGGTAVEAGSLDWHIREALKARAGGR
jgi:hypothetical protein